VLLSLLTAAVVAVAPQAASAAPRLTRIGAHLRGFQAEFIAVAPDGTAYVDGGNTGQRVSVFSPSGALERTFQLSKPGYVGTYGNGQLYITEPPDSTLAGNLLIANPANGAFTGSIGGPGLFGATTGVAVAPGGDVLVTSDEGAQTTDPSDPESVITVNDAVMSFDPADSNNYPQTYSSFVSPVYPGSTDVGNAGAALFAVNNAGDLLAAYPANTGKTYAGVFSPQGAMLGHFANEFPQITGMTFAPGGDAIIATVENDSVTNPTTATTYLALLSFSGKVLERFGTLHLVNKRSDSFNSYLGVAVAPNGVGWVAQGLGGQLYRFKL
jgi:hypothetical protein